MTSWSHEVCPLMPFLSAHCLTWVSLTLDVGISLRLLQKSATAAPELGRGVAPLPHAFAQQSQPSWVSIHDLHFKPLLVYGLHIQQQLTSMLNLIKHTSLHFFFLFLEYLRSIYGASLVGQGKESACNSGDLGWTPEEGNGNPLQYSCLGNMDRAVWWVIVQEITKESDTT